MIEPRYPVYVPSKGRAARCLTADWLIRDGVPFRIVIEPCDVLDYSTRYGYDRLLVMPRDNMTLIGARNWIRTHAEAAGAARHWQLDDNIRRSYYRYQRHRMYVTGAIALRACEDFTDRYANVAISGLNYSFLVKDRQPIPPFYVNGKVYSCSLINHAMPYRWRLLYNDDTDICLQALAGGWCTLTLNAFLIDKQRTMTMSGGNTDALYRGDGRLRMARSLERMWPGVVTTDRRFQRPQHVVADAWRKFDTPLIKVEPPNPEYYRTDNYGLTLAILREPTERQAAIIAQHSAKDSECTM